MFFLPVVFCCLLPVYSIAFYLLDSIESINNLCTVFPGRAPAQEGNSYMVLSVTVLFVIVLSVMVLSVIVLSVIVLSVIVLSVIVLSVIVLSVIVLSVIVLSVSVLSVSVLSVSVLSGIFYGYRASAPATISDISLVIVACRI